MTTLTPYLLFDGNCQPAMEFYESCLDGELTLLRVKDSPAKDFMPPTLQERIVNARLKSANIELSASDWLRPDRTRIRGNNVCLFLNCATSQELNTLLARLAEGGQITDPPKEMFFGTYGAFNDQFGIRWMLRSGDGR